MQEYWEMYMKEMEGRPASVLFNAGISMELEEVRYSYPTVAFVKVALKEPTENGLLSEAESPEVGYLEDKLEAALIKFRIGKYVGKVISNGEITFIYYVQYTYNWQDFLDFVLAEFSHYSFTAGHQEDSEWNFYRKLLYPTAIQWQLIQNHKTCDHLQANGDNLYLPRAIEHSLFFEEDETKKEPLIQWLEREGFNVQSEITNEDTGANGLRIYRIDKPHYHAIDQLTLGLIETLQQYGASYDGWETSIVKS